MKLSFVFNKNYDKKTAEFLLSLKRYTRKDIDSIDSLYKNSTKILKMSQRMYQESWNEIDKEFFKFVEKITGYKWAYKNYECVISVINPGVSNWGVSNKIMLWWKFNPFFMRRIAAHELILHHYFEIYKRKYTEHNLTDRQVWALAETAAYTITSLPKEVKKFWPWSINYYGSYLPGTSYPQLNEIREKLKQPFLKRKNFDDYIMEGIKLIKRYNIK